MSHRWTVTSSLGPLERPVTVRLAALNAERVVDRMWARDPTLWGGSRDTSELLDRLGWLDLPARAGADAAAAQEFVANLGADVRHVVLCGMGGSSLAPDVLSRASPAARSPDFRMLDSTHPDAIAATDAACPARDTLYLIASKSGTTVETSSFFSHYWSTTGGAGSQFAAITDPGSALATLAAARAFRRVWLAPPDVGGRYSALSVFGLAPAALAGADVAKVARAGEEMVVACRLSDAAENPGAWLGAVLAEAARAGRDKLTILEGQGTGRFGLWAEQLVAESTGKAGKGMVPVVGEPVGAPDAYGQDRIFVSVSVQDSGSGALDAALSELERAGQPVVRVALGGGSDLGGEFFRWEFATAVAGAMLGVNPFDQPNVAGSKANTADLLRRGVKAGAASSPDEIRRLLADAGERDYLAVLAYLPDTEENGRRLRALAARWRDGSRRAVTAGLGPRYLHSTGQLHKGGPSTGRFIVVLPAITDDCPVPGADYTFGTLLTAQAAGDIAALRRRGRPVVQVSRLDALEKVAWP
ncbi:MAG TPA: hypothetical protein VD793_07640 [Gemmatimonadales bacterium]|nr:hypothetical protein [Gemmatimonadales bacterium]